MCSNPSFYKEILLEDSSTSLSLSGISFQLNLENNREQRRHGVGEGGVIHQLIFYMFSQSNMLLEYLASSLAGHTNQDHPNKLYCQCKLIFVLN